MWHKRFCAFYVYFNPRSSCEERHSIYHRLHPSQRYFNPRSSCEERRGVTDYEQAIEYFNPRSSCEERRPSHSRPSARAHFNPRSSCEERPAFCVFMIINFEFQSTLLMRGATGRDGDARPLRHISIHAPHARSDPQIGQKLKAGYIFQSTLLMRGAT